MKHRKPWLLLTLSALALSSLAFVACGGDDDDGGDSDSSSSSKDEKKDSEKKDDEKTTTKDDKKDSGGGVTGSGADEFKKLAKDATGKTYTATYQLETDDTESGFAKANWTTARKGDKSYTRIEVAEGEDKGSEILLVDDGKKSYFCNREAKAKTGSCLVSPSTDDGDLGFLSIEELLKESDTSTSVTEAGDRKIAGSDSKCFKFKDSDKNEGTTCFDKKTGIVTALDGTDKDGAKTKMTATKFSASADDSLFAPPKDWEVLDIGG